MSTANADRKQLVKVAMKILATTFNKALSDDLLLGYFIGLEKLSDEQLQEGVHRALSECKAFPTPAHLIELSGYVTLDRRKYLAWTDAQKAVVWPGYCSSVRFEDKLTNATIYHLDGWPAFCDWFTRGPREVNFLESRFLKKYEALAGMLNGDEPECGYLQGCNTIEPPRIKVIKSSIASECLTYANRSALPKPITQLLPSIGMMPGAN